MHVVGETGCWMVTCELVAICGAGFDWAGAGVLAGAGAGAWGSGSCARGGGLAAIGGAKTVGIGVTD